MISYREGTPSRRCRNL